MELYGKSLTEFQASIFADALFLDSWPVSDYDAS